MASFKNKHIKIRLLCERAEQEESLRETLEAQGLTQDQIDQTIRAQRSTGFKPVHENLPWEEDKKVITTLHATNSGLPGTHLVKSSTKDMMEKTQRKYDKYNAQKQTQKEGMGSTIQSVGQLSEADEAKKAKKESINR
jgi:hypothetical protein